MDVICARGVYDAYVAPFDGAPGVGIDCSKDIPITKQADLKDTDINSIMRRFEKTGTLPDMIAREARYGDFSDALEYQDALGVVEAAKTQFNALDAHVRNRFDNDPSKFLAFVGDPANLEELEKMDLLNADAKARLATKRQEALDARIAAAKSAAGTPA